MESDVEKIVIPLIHKTGDTNKFLRFVPNSNSSFLLLFFIDIIENFRSTIQYFKKVVGNIELGWTDKSSVQNTNGLYCL